MRETEMGEVELRGKAEEGGSGTADTARGPPGPGGHPHPPQDVTSLLTWLQSLGDSPVQERRNVLWLPDSRSPVSSPLRTDSAFQGTF